MPDPRLFFLGRTSCELPAGWRGLEADPAWGVEIIPGVRVACTGTGDFLLPDGRVVHGAGIAVWDERPEPAEVEWGIRGPGSHPGAPPHVRNYGEAGEGEKLARMLLPDHERVYGKHGKVEVVTREIPPWTPVETPVRETEEGNG